MVWFDSTNIQSFSHAWNEFNGDISIDMNTLDGVRPIPTMAEFSPLVALLHYLLTWLVIIGRALGVDSA